MTQEKKMVPGDILTSFFLKLSDVESIIRIVLQQTRIHIMLTIRGEQDRTVVIDFTKQPARFALDTPTQVGHVVAAIDDNSLHEILMGHQQAGLALGRRQLLLRGSASHLAKLIPLFDFAPVLYPEFLRKLHTNKKNENKSLEEITMQIQDGSAVLEKVEKCNHPLCFIFNWIAYGLGYIVGIIRYRLFEKLNIFDLLQEMARGIDAATPKKRGNTSSNATTTPARTS